MTGRLNKLLGLNIRKWQDEDIANLESLEVLVHHSALYSLEVQATLGHQGALETLLRSLHEHPFHLAPRTGRAHRAVQGFLLTLCCQEPPSLHGSQENLYWKTINVNKENQSGPQTIFKSKISLSVLTWWSRTATYALFSCFSFLTLCSKRTLWSFLTWKTCWFTN